MGKTEELKRLENDLNSDKELREKFDAESLRIAKENSGANDEEIFVKAAAAFGYHFSLADLGRARADVESLDLEEMEKVLGGVSCWKDFRCINISYHEVTPKPQYNTEG